MRRPAILALLATCVMASGCVDKIAESRVRSALVTRGVPDPIADCMAGRMVERLTISQLRKLEALKGDYQTVGDYLGAVRRVGDPEVVSVTASSAALCSTGLAR